MVSCELETLFNGLAQWEGAIALPFYGFYPLQFAAQRRHVVGLYDEAYSGLRMLQ